MAQPNKIHAILAELVADISQISPERHGHDLRKQSDWARRTIRSNNFARVNQFDVESTLQGLVEKFMVMNREDLSLALAEKLDLLKTYSDKCTPDVLFLLLQLSDQPVNKLPPYTAPSRQIISGPPGLTWDQILAEDPYSDEELWNKAAYSAASSESEENSVPSLEPSAASKPAQVKCHDQRHVQPFVEIDEELLLAKRQQQYWLQSRHEEYGSKSHIPEMQAIREVLLMLRGLPTSLFSGTGEGKVRFCDRFQLEQVTGHVFADLLRSFATIGERLSSIRSWAGITQTEILQQTFRASVQKQILSFDREVASLEVSLLSTHGQVLVSLARTLDDIRAKSRSLLFLQGQLVTLSNYTSPFDHLEMLFDLVCEQQTSGDHPLMYFLGIIFFESLQSFLLPIQLWMTEGIINSDASSFFIVEIDGHLNNDSIWNDQFHFRLADNQEILAPTFVHTSASRILNTGKSIRFINKLGLTTDYSSQPRKKLRFEDVCDLSGQVQLVSFPILFDHAFSKWVESMYGPASTILREQLLTTYNLQRSLAALQDIYLSVEGTRLQAFADPMFEALDRKLSTWNDKYLLSERLKAVFATDTNVNVDLLSVRTISMKNNARGFQMASSIVLHYQLSWPVMNIVRKQSLALYQKSFRLLLHIYRAKYLLRETLHYRDKHALSHLATCLKQQLHSFVDTLLTHFLHAVIQPLGERMQIEISLARDLDEMIAVHDKYIMSIQKQCLLTKNLVPIHQAMSSILDSVERFCLCLRHQEGVTSKAGVVNSKIFSTKVRGRASGMRRRQREIATSSDESAQEHDVEDAYEADTETLMCTPDSTPSQLHTMKIELDNDISFIVTGLRGIGRAGGEATWEMLADRLDWSNKHDINTIE